MCVCVCVRFSFPVLLLYSFLVTPWASSLLALPTDVSATALGSLRSFPSFVRASFYAILRRLFFLSLSLFATTFSLTLSFHLVPVSLSFSLSRSPTARSPKLRPSCFRPRSLHHPFRALRFSICPRIVLPVLRPRRRPFWYQPFPRFAPFQNEALANSIPRQLFCSLTLLFVFASCINCKQFPSNRIPSSGQRLRSYNQFYRSWTFSIPGSSNNSSSSKLEITRVMRVELLSRWIFYASLY